MIPGHVSSVGVPSVWKTNTPTLKSFKLFQFKQTGARVIKGVAEYHDVIFWWPADVPDFGVTCCWRARFPDWVITVGNTSGPFNEDFTYITGHFRVAFSHSFKTESSGAKRFNFKSEFLLIFSYESSRTRILLGWKQLGKSLGLLVVKTNQKVVRTPASILVRHVA